MSHRTYHFHLPHRSPPSYATAKRIAGALLEQRAILQLSTGLIVSDIKTRFQCCQSTAMRAVGIARRA